MLRHLTPFICLISEYILKLQHLLSLFKVGVGRLPHGQNSAQCLIFFFFFLNDLWASQVAQWVKNPPAIQDTQADVSSIPRSGKSSGGGHVNALQYFCLENPMD